MKTIILVPLGTLIGGFLGLILLIISGQMGWNTNSDFIKQISGFFFYFSIPFGLFLGMAIGIKLSRK